MNIWWENNLNQKFWVEITDRDDLGKNIVAPVAAKQGKATYGYELVRHVKPGDIVLHWWKRDKDLQKHGFYGFSTVAGEMYEDAYIWKSRGRYANSIQNASKRGNFWTLVDFVEFQNPILRKDLNSSKFEIVNLISSLEKKYGKPIYFPFCEREGKISANQTYFAKLPFEFLKIISIPELDNFANEHGTKPTDIIKNPFISRAIQVDPAKRSAVEKYAELKVSELFTSRGFKITKFGKPFDLLAVKGEKILKIEVKGKQQTAVSIDLTRNEVALSKNASSEYEVLLCVVDQIILKEEGKVWVASGGRLRIWINKPFDDFSLIPTAFNYILDDLHDEIIDCG